MSEKRTEIVTPFLKTGRSKVGPAPHPGHGQCHMHCVSWSSKAVVKCIGLHVTAFFWAQYERFMMEVTEMAKTCKP